MREIRAGVGFYDVLGYEAVNFGKYFSLKKAYSHDGE
jgi:hypothetical protein